jgi:glyceraldehyde 3-phosphate dehydrogenase
MAFKVGINGFGRIGRNIFRESLNRDNIDVVLINDLTDAKTLAHLLKYDSIHGTLDAEVKAAENSIFVNGREIKVTAIKDPALLPWKASEVDVVMECTGLFRKKEQALKHIQAGAKKVLISAPSPDPDVTIVMGVNEGMYDPDKHHVISNASCTTNCLAPLAKILNDSFTIKKGLMTTIHAFTNDQRILDLPHSDLRRARSAAMSMIPTTTGAAAAVALVLPELQGKLDGMAIRVPTPNVSVVDLVVEVEKDTDTDEVQKAVEYAAEHELQGILICCKLPLVSIDFNNNPHSSIVDCLSTKVIGGNMIKMLSWYDNEWGYSCRMLDLAAHIMQ